MIFHLPGIIQRHKLLIYNLRTQRKFRLWPASGSNPGDFEQDQFTDEKFGTQIVANQNYFIQISRD